MSASSILILTQHNKAQLSRLAFLQEYHRRINETQSKLMLAQMIEDTQEALARAASRLRQLGEAPARILEEEDDKLLRQSRSRRGDADQLRFVWQGLKGQLEWYQGRHKELQSDPDTQAIFVALTEQTRLRLERLEGLMKSLKVPLH
jgi:hypothetical protein